MSDKENFDNIINNNKNEQGKLVSEETQKLLKRNIVIQEYAPLEYVGLKDLMLEISLKGETKIILDSPNHNVYDNVFLKESDFIPNYQEFIKRDNTEPNISFEFSSNYISFHRNHNKENSIGKDYFFTQLLINLNSYEEKLEEENKKLKEAKESYTVILKKMEEAKEKGLFEIEYDPLHNESGKTYSVNNYNFALHKEWLTKLNPNMIIWLKRIEKKSPIDSSCFNLCWREKYYYEKAVSYLWSFLY